MNAYMIFSGSGPIVILTSHPEVTHSGLLEKLHAKGIEKFIAYELPLDVVKRRYGAHYDVVIRDLHETDDLRVLDYNGQRAFSMFHFDELGPQTVYESGA